MARGDMARRGRADAGQASGASEALGAQADGDMQLQLALVERRPRRTAEAAARIEELATFDLATAEEMHFALVSDGKVVRAPSIRFAELVAHGWGHCRTAARTVHVGRDFVEVEGVFHDLETNALTITPVRRATRRPGGDRVTLDGALSVAASIARRNAILSGVPKPVWRASLAAAEALIVGEDIVGRAREILDGLADLGVSQERAIAAVGGADQDIADEHVLALHAALAAIRSGEAEADDLFPEPGAVPPAAEGFSHAHVRRELDGPETLAAEPPVDAPPAPAEAEPALAAEAQPSPLERFASAFEGHVAAAGDEARLDQIVEQAAELLTRLHAENTGRALGLRALVVRRRQELSPPPPVEPGRDETVDLFAEQGIAA